MLVISFDSEDLRILFEDDSAAHSLYYPELATRLMKRISDLRSMPSLMDFPKSFRQLIGQGNEQKFAILLTDGYKILLSSNGQKTPILEDGSPDWAQVRRIKILGILN